MKSLVRVFLLVSMAVCLCLFMAGAGAQELEKLQKTGDGLDFEVRRGFSFLRERKLLDLGNGRRLKESDIFVISNLDRWLAASGYDKVYLRLPKAEQEKLQKSSGFILEVTVDGQRKPLPYLPIYLRSDSEGWMENVRIINGRPPFNNESSVVAGLLVHEIEHARGKEEAEALAAELRLLRSLRFEDLFQGTRADEYIFRLEELVRGGR